MFDRLMERFHTGWELAKQSLHVLRLDKELLWFPIFSGVACLLVLGSFAVPIWMSGLVEAAQKDRSTATNIMLFAIAFAFYFVNFFVIYFFNSALVACAVIRLKGGDPIVSDGIGAAMARLPQIAGWALVSATVGLILKAIESRSEQFGSLVANLLGMAWSVISFFVIPVLVIEKVGPIAAIRRSTSIMEKTWGESLAANFGIGLIVFFAFLLGMVPLGLAALAFSNQLVILGIVLGVLGVLYMLAVSLVSTALNSIITAALYIYAAEGEKPQLFDAGALQHAFATKH